MSLHLHPFTFLGLIAGIAYTWFLVAAILDCATSPRSDIGKINWITVVLTFPIIGMLVYLCFGGVRRKQEPPSEPTTRAAER